jgi:16S rRNA (cytosine967-C5)-methyltransferase
VLVDAPCSGVGTWARNPDARWRTDEKSIRSAAKRQRAILSHAATAVRPGGRLVYAVCTITRAETIDVVEAFNAQQPDFELVPFPHPLTGIETAGTVFIEPWQARCGAMFIAHWQRRG